MRCIFVLQDCRFSDPDHKGNLHFIFSEALVFNSPTWKVYFPWSSFLTSLTDKVCLPRRDDMTYLMLEESSLSSKNQLPSASSRDTRHSNSPEYVSGTSVLSSCFRISSGAPVDHIIQPVNTVFGENTLRQSSDKTKKYFFFLPHADLPSASGSRSNYFTFRGTVSLQFVNCMYFSEERKKSLLLSCFSRDSCEPTHLQH